MNQIRVNLDAQTPTHYKIYIGRDIIDRIGVILNKGDWINRYVIITDSQVKTIHGKRVLDTLRKMDLNVDMIDFSAGESSKNIQTSLQLVDSLIALGADRHSGPDRLGRRSGWGYNRVHCLYLI